MNDLPTALHKPDRALLQAWLSDIHVEHYLCGDCDGLHVNALHSIEGVVNSRVFAQQSHVLFSTELEVRPMAVLPLASELGRINMDYPSLKVFLDVVDDATPQLVASAHCLTGVGITRDQFAEFMLNAVDGMRLLADECLRLDYLFAEASRPSMEGNSVVH